MTKWRTDLIQGDPLPQDFFDALQEFIGTYVSSNFTVAIFNPTTLRVPAGADNAQVGIGINGKWRYNAVNADAAAPGGLTVGDNPLFVTASANVFTANPSPPPTELDQTDYSFHLLVLPSGQTPTGSGTQAQWRQIGTVTWDGSQFTAVKLNIADAAGATRTSDITARTGLATQTLIGSVGGAAGIALGSAGDVTIKRDTTGGNKATVNVPVNATAFQIGGTPLAAEHLSNGVTGSGAVALAASPGLTGTPTVPTAAVDTNTTQAASTAFVLAQAASATPAMDGAAAVGTSTRYARADHVHPIDTSRAPLASPTFTGTPAAPTAAGGTSTTQLATTAFVMAAIGGLPGAPVTSVFGRSGAVSAQSGDYAVAQITGAAADNVVVHLAGGETVTGAKQFSVGPRWATQSLAAAGTLADGTASVVLADTTTAAFTATLPLTPTAGSWFRFIDAASHWGTNNLTIGRNGKTIDGAAANLVLARDNATVTLYYDGTGWRTVGAGLVSPALTGVPTAPTAAVDTNTTQLATTAWVLGQSGVGNPAMDGTASGGTSSRWARQDHVHPTDTSRAPLASPTFTGTPAAPTAAVDTSTTQLATTGFVLSQAAAANPLMNGAVAVGTSTRFARADHVHPVDTSRAPLASPTLTGTPAGPTAAVDTSTTQLATTAFVIGQAAAATPLMNGAAAVGTSTRYARGDHVHPIDTSRAPLASPTFTGVLQADRVGLSGSSGYSVGGTRALTINRPYSAGSVLDGLRVQGVVNTSVMSYADFGVTYDATGYAYGAIAGNGVEVLTWDASGTPGLSGFVNLVGPTKLGFGATNAGTAPDTALYRSAAGTLQTDAWFIANNAIRSLGGSAGGGVLQGGNTFNGGNNWMTGMVAGNLYFDGSNWQNKTYGGNNGWGMIGFGGASAPGEINFYIEGATGVADRSYTQAQMQARRVVTFRSDGTLVLGTAQTTWIDSAPYETGSIRLNGSNGWGILYMGNSGGGYIRPFGGGLNLCDGANGSVSQIGFLGHTPVARQGPGAPTANTRGVGTTWLIDNTTTGGVGSTAYTIQDIVAALKNYGLLTA